MAGLMASATLAGAAQPYDWELGFQPSATPVHDRMTAFHHELLIIITLITVFVLGLLLYVMVRFHHSRNPKPTQITHNAVVEITWTVVPVIILLAIFFPSIGLMYYMDRVPKADMTIKATGNQWFWNYAYADQKIAFDSNIVDAKDLKAGQPRLLTVDNPLVVPVGATVRVQVTGVAGGVIHSWFIPSFGVQEYAVPGRLNETWFRVEKPGTYYGECNQICGINHSRMPIEVQALSKPDFDKWLTGAKTKFASNPPDDNAIVAAAAAASRPHAAGN
ncbi:MAG TPA: cytochrome c oxidase subunit II [Stellaceae bacterium]|nr:cytochrome c oxidase subunit II [Stellaceae bacterium]